MGNFFESLRREKMLFLALIAVASAVQYNVMYTYSDATCTTANANGVFAVPTAGTVCTQNTNCSNTGFKVECNVATATVPSKATCGLNTYTSNTDCTNTANPTRVIRFEPGACHNIDEAFLNGAGMGLACPTTAKSLRPSTCSGAGAGPGLPTTYECFQEVGCTKPCTTTPFTTPTTQPTTTSNATTPAPKQCKTCTNPGVLPTVSYSYCGASFMQASVAVVALVAVLVAAF